MRGIISSNEVMNYEWVKRLHAELLRGVPLFIHLSSAVHSSGEVQSVSSSCLFSGLKETILKKEYKDKGVDHFVGICTNTNSLHLTGIFPHWKFECSGIETLAYSNLAPFKSSRIVCSQVTKVMYHKHVRNSRSIDINIVMYL